MKLFRVMLICLFATSSFAGALNTGDAIDIRCKELRSLSFSDLEHLITGAELGAAAMGIAVSSFSKVGIESRDDYLYVKGLAWSASNAINSESLLDKVKATCSEIKNSDTKIVNILLEHVTSTLIKESVK